MLEARYAEVEMFAKFLSRILISNFDSMIEIFDKMYDSDRIIILLEFNLIFGA